MFPDLEFIKTCLNGLRHRIEQVEKQTKKVIAVKAVDADGKPTEWETVDAVDVMVVSSSTPDSTKKFKITVDDSGTILN